MNLFVKAFRMLFKGTVDLPNPGDWVRTDAITIQGAKVTIDFSKLNVPLGQDPVINYFDIESTKNMLPVFGYRHNNILLKGQNQRDQQLILGHIKVGDIIVASSVRGKIIHRVDKVDSDSHGRYFKTQGDNVYRTDPEVFRDEHILWVCPGTFY